LGLIRSTQSVSTARFSFVDVESEARKIQRRAEAEARELVRRAEEEGRRIHDRRHAEGYALGLREGRVAGERRAHQEAAAAALREAQEGLAKLGAALQTALADFQRDKRRLLAEAEAGVIELAVRIAERICKHAAARSSETALQNARAALELARHDQDAELRVSPEELAALEQALPALLSAIAGLEHVRVIPDERVPRGGCVVRGRQGEIDARLETQIQRVADALLPARERVE